MPNTDPDTAVVACTTLPRHLGLATDVSSTNLLALVVVCKCVCIDGEGEGVGRSRQGLGGSRGMQVRLSPLRRFPKIRNFKRKSVPCIYKHAAKLCQNAANYVKMWQNAAKENAVTYIKCGKLCQNAAKCGNI